MTPIQLLHQIAEQVPTRIPNEDGRIWVTKARGDYITCVGLENKWSLLEFLIEHGATQYVQSIWEAGKPVNIAFSPIEQKWYGWSHRAVHGFGVGSECKRGDCHYRPTDKHDFLQDMIRFWTEPHHVNVRGGHTGAGVYIEWEYSHAVPNEALRGTTGGSTQPYPKEYGRGEWTAETLADARQMAIDFAEGVS